MIDFKHKVFLSVCRMGNFTKAAEELNMSQPAVSQNILALEQWYEGKLLYFDKRQLKLTEKGERLFQILNPFLIDSQKAEKEIIHGVSDTQTLNFGATLTIGEFSMPPILAKILKENSQLLVKMQVNNTHELLKNLDLGIIDFALVEGYFNKEQYESLIFSEEKFIAVTSPAYLKLENSIAIEELFGCRIISREKGSGTRRIFENFLEEKNIGIESFSYITEVANMGAIKELLKKGIGISFLYKKAVQKEIEEGSLVEIKIDDFEVLRPFSFIYLKNSFYEARNRKWYERLKES